MAQFYNSTICEDSNIPTSSTPLVLVYPFCYSYLCEWKWHLIVDFWLLILVFDYWWLMTLSIFSCNYWVILYFLWRNIYSNLFSFQAGCLFFNCWVVSILYIFWIPVLFRYVICKYFSPFFLDSVHWRTKVFFCCWSPIYIFFLFFFVCPFGVLSKKLFLNSWSLSFYIMFFSKSFIVLTLTFKSMIHFELIFACCVR